MSKPANSKKTAPKRKAPPNAWKPGQSGNAAGAPRRGESWAEIIKRIGEMTPKEAANHCRAVAGRLGEIGTGVTLKEAVVLRVYTSIMFEPSVGLLNTFMDRVEGKVADKLEIADWRDALTQHGADAEATFRELVDKLEPKLLQSPAMIDIPQPAALQPAEFTDATDPSK